MQFNYSYNTTASGTTTPVAVSLLVTTSDTANADGSYTATDITGTWNGQVVTGLSTYAGADNSFFPTNNSPAAGTGVGYETANGLAFSVATNTPGAIAGDDGAGNVNVSTIPAGFIGNATPGDYEYDATSNTVEPLTSEAASPICYLAGTHILTDRGEVPVEKLRVGDLLVTPHGPEECMAIRWIGRQHLEGACVAYGQPVLIRMGALGSGIPHKDLRVSGDHCLFLDGNLVPARLLVNNSTIVVESHHVILDYINIEFDRHTILIAEGIEAESYLDCGNRARFDNAFEVNEWLSSRTERDATAWFHHAFALPIWDGARLDALRTRIAGWATGQSNDRNGRVSATIAANTHSTNTFGQEFYPV